LLYVLYGIFFVSCLVLVASVLLQPGKTDAGALFTSNISSSAFGPRGTASVLSKITIVAASLFMVVAFLISMPAFQGGSSVLQAVPDVTTEPAPVVIEGDANANVTQPDANSAVPPTNAAGEETGTEPAPAANSESPANN
jgi:preprotein translocase subunit SecG